MTEPIKPLNQWIEEEVTIPVTSAEYEDGQVKTVTKNKTFTQKTFYSDNKPTKVICTSHEYECVDKGTYHFKCTKCKWNKIAPPHIYRYNPDTKILSNRLTGNRV